MSQASKNPKQDNTKAPTTPPENISDKQAVGLKYTGSGAPIVTAKGQGYVAEQIIAIAKEHNIPISEDTDLISMLSQVELDQEIPEVLYEAVVQVLVFAYNLSGKEIPSSPDSTD